MDRESTFLSRDRFYIHWYKSTCIFTCIFQVLVESLSIRIFLGYYHCTLAQTVRIYTTPNNVFTTKSAHTTMQLHQKPPLPATLSLLPANEVNRACLQQWLLDNYATLCLQPLLLMHGPLMLLMVNVDATTVAHHIPIQVPLHWQEHVKADLDQDVA